MYLSKSFESYDFYGIKLKNRFVRSATSENMAEEGLPSEQLLMLYEELARSEIGLIITSAMRPDRTWARGSQQKNMVIDRDDSISSFRELTDLIHSFGSKVAAQFGSFFVYNGEPVAPSAIPYDWIPGVTPRALKVEEIKEIVNIYGIAGERAKKAGFDAVQIHAAHGYPLSRFLSPLFNQRTDEYGGSPENRARIITEIAAEIRVKAGSDFPVFVKMGVVDFCDGGLTKEDGVEVAKALSQNGISAIETSAGTPGSEMNALGATNNPQWKDRDIFILSKGHAAPALYTVLSKIGFIDRNELFTLREFGSKLQGHPVKNNNLGIEITTGSLGMGLSIGVGCALAAKLEKNEKKYIYILLGDGELNEGAVWEAAMAASHYKLDNLIAIVDRNGIQ